LLKKTALQSANLKELIRNRSSKNLSRLESESKYPTPKPLQITNTYIRVKGTGSEQKRKFRTVNFIK